MVTLRINIEFIPLRMVYPRGQVGRDRVPAGPLFHNSDPLSAPSFHFPPSLVYPKSELVARL